jgi:hypothetical protein
MQYAIAIDMPMSVLILHPGEVSFLVARMRAIIVRVLPWVATLVKRGENTEKTSTKPMLSPHKAPLPSTGGTSWGVFVTTIGQ